MPKLERGVVLTLGMGLRMELGEVPLLEVDTALSVERFVVEWIGTFGEEIGAWEVTLALEGRDDPTATV